MIDIRLRTQIPDDELNEKVGKILTDDDYNLLATRDTLVRKPDGSPLAIFRKGAIPPELREQAYPMLHEFRRVTTSNRGVASGSERVEGGSGKRSYSREVPSSIIGAFDPSGPQTWCRQTAFSGRETEKMTELFPFLRFVGDAMYEAVPDRWLAQSDYVKKTDPAWVIPGTPFTTVTINNTWPTAVHTDKGDLDEGFSNLAVLRRGDYRGGVFVFPRYRVGFDLHDGDLILMDAHEWHGNTQIECATCGEKLNGYHECWIDRRGYETSMEPEVSLDSEIDEPLNVVERISVVAYYRTNMVKCGTPADEAEKQRIAQSERAAARIGE